MVAVGMPVPRHPRTTPGVRYDRTGCADASAPSQSPMAGLPTRPARSPVNASQTPLPRPAHDSEPVCLGEAAGRRRLPAPQCAVSSRTSVSEGRCHCNTPRQRLCGHPDHRRLHAAVPGRERETTPLSTVRGHDTPSGRRSLRRLAGHVARLNRASLWLLRWPVQQCIPPCVW